MIDNKGLQFFKEKHVKCSQNPIDLDGPTPTHPSVQRIAEETLRNSNPCLKDWRYSGSNKLFVSRMETESRFLSVFSLDLQTT